MKVAKWGNSLAIRLPAAVVDALGLKEGDEIEIRVADAQQFGIIHKPSREELLKRLRVFRGRLPRDFKLDRGRRERQVTSSAPMAFPSAIRRKSHHRAIVDYCGIGSERDFF